MDAQAIQPLPKLETMTAICREAREDVLDLLNRNPETADLRWRMDRSPRLLAIDAAGNRLNDDGWHSWTRRKSDVESLLRNYPEATEVVVDSGVDVAATREDYEGSNYDPFFWQATIWRHDRPVYSIEQLEEIVRRRTGFRSFSEMFNKTRDGYRPSIDVRDPEMLAIANHYDRLATNRGDERRAYRYGALVRADDPAPTAGPRPGT